MKKTIMILTLIILCLSLSSCGKTTTGKENTQVQTKAQPQTNIVTNAISTSSKATTKPEETYTGDSVKIDYMGHSCFKLTSKEGSLVIDPYKNVTGLEGP